MRILQRITPYFNLFSPPTLKEIIEQELRNQIEVKMQAQNVVLSHQFQVHMCEANIKALVSWNAKLNNPVSDYPINESDWKD